MLMEYTAEQSLTGGYQEFQFFVANWEQCGKSTKPYETHKLTVPFFPFISFSRFGPVIAYVAQRTWATLTFSKPKHRVSIQNTRMYILSNFLYNKSVGNKIVRALIVK